MDDDDDDDLLLDLLTYQCPLTGHKRVAGSVPEPAPKYLDVHGIFTLFTPVSQHRDPSKIEGCLLFVGPSLTQEITSPGTLGDNYYFFTTGFG